METQSTMPSTGSYQKSLARLYVGFSVVTLIAIGVAVWVLIHLRHEAENRAVTNLHNLAVSLEQTIEGKIDTLDMALLASTDEISHQTASIKPDQQSVTRFLIQQQKRVPHLDLLRATNEKGETIFGEGVPTPPASIADRDYFARLRDNPKAGLVISKPIIGKISQKWIWLFARRINKPDGSFGGVVYGSIFIDELSKMLAQFKIGQDGVIALRDAEMATVARNIFDAQDAKSIGDKRLSAPAQEAMKINTHEGTFLADTSAIDGFSRWYAYHHNARYGFTIFVGVPVSAVLDEWKFQAAFVVTILATFMLAAFAYLRQVRQAWIGHEQDTAKLARLHEELIQQELQVRQLAFYDPLTNLPNRRLLSDRLSQTMAASKRGGCYGALLFLDLDNFKPLNDMHGHRVGDLLLMEVADRIRSCVREIDTVARMGGDEFVVVISDINVDAVQSTKQAHMVAEKILSSLAEPYLLRIKHQGKAEQFIEHHCSVSIGIALFLNHEISEKDLIACADKAMYQAKLAGRNTIRFWE
jgi:diguanylate cyclase (GGDEF)-like protein